VKAAPERLATFFQLDQSRQYRAVWTWPDVALIDARREMLERSK
jgi:hypothetical protein